MMLLVNLSISVELQIDVSTDATNKELISNGDK